METIDSHPKEYFVQWFGKLRSDGLSAFQVLVNCCSQVVECTRLFQDELLSIQIPAKTLGPKIPFSLKVNKLAA